MCHKMSNCFTIVILYSVLYFYASLLYMFIDCVKCNPKCMVHSTGIGIMVAYHSFHGKSYTVYYIRKDNSMKVILNYVLWTQDVNFSLNVTYPQLLLRLQFVFLLIHSGLAFGVQSTCTQTILTIISFIIWRILVICVKQCVTCLKLKYLYGNK